MDCSANIREDARLFIASIRFCSGTSTVASAEAFEMVSGGTSDRFTPMAAGMLAASGAAR